MMAMIADMEVDLIVVAKPNKALGEHPDGWYMSTGGKAF